MRKPLTGSTSPISTTGRPARLDFAKLGSVNAHWIRTCDPERLVELVSADLATRGTKVDDAMREILGRALPLVKERAQTIPQLSDAIQFAIARGPFVFDDKTKNLLTEETVARLQRLHKTVLTWASWDNEVIDVELKKFVENEQVGFGKVGPVLRGVLSPGMAAPDISRLFAGLGREESLIRLGGALSN